jgi:hypothetical protein
MSESSPGDPQFTGQADAKTPEAPVPQEFVLSGEQKRVVDVMETEGVKLETAVLAAREKAAGALKQLHGKELVRVGVTMMGRGVWESVKAEVNGLIRGGLFGAAIGVIGGATLGILSNDPKNIAPATAAGGFVGGVTGGVSAAFLDYEFSGVRYNIKSEKEHLPPVRWYDWVASHLGTGWMISLLGRTGLANRPIVRDLTRPFIMATFINPITVGGLRNVALGLWQMRKR